MSGELKFGEGLGETGEGKRRKWGIRLKEGHEAGMYKMDFQG